MSNIKHIETEFPDIYTFINEYHPGHDPIQIRNFIVLGEGITDWGAYRQACAEIHTHYTAARQAELAIKKLLAEIEVIKARISEARYENTQVSLAIIQVLEVEIEEKRLAIELNEQAFRRAAYELSVLVPLARELRNRLVGKDVNEMILEYHTERLKRLAAEEVLGPVMTKAAYLPESVRKPLLDELTQIKHKSIPSSHDDGWA